MDLLAGRRSDWPTEWMACWSGIVGRGANWVTTLVGASEVEPTVDELGAIDLEIVVCHLLLLRIAMVWGHDKYMNKVQ